MPVISYKGITIKGVASCVPKNVVRNDADPAGLFGDKFEKYVKSVGIEEYREAPESICTSDLCYGAAKRLMEDLSLDPTSIDVLIFNSMSGDYRFPPTCGLLQARLGLRTDILASDTGRRLGASWFIIFLAIKTIIYVSPYPHTSAGRR